MVDPNRSSLRRRSWLAVPALTIVALLCPLAGHALAAGAFADDFADATREFGAKDWYEGVRGDITSATKEPGEPDHAGYPGGASVWMPWTSPKDQVVEIWACGTGAMDALLGVYTGNSVSELTEIASNDESSLEHGCGPPGAGVRFEATGNTKYMLAVDAKAEGALFRADIRTVPSNDDFEDALAVPAELPYDDSVDNRIATRQAGEPEHAGYGLGRTVWYEWTAPKSGLVAIDACANSNTAIGVYTGGALNELTEVASNDHAGGYCHNDAEVRFNAVEGTTYKVALDGVPYKFQLDIDFRWVAKRQLTVATTGSGMGTVTSEPTGIECGAICEAGFYYGSAGEYSRTTVELVATPDPGSAFTGWSGEGCSGTENCVLVMEEPSYAITANFELESPLRIGGGESSAAVAPPFPYVVLPPSVAPSPLPVASAPSPRAASKGRKSRRSQCRAKRRNAKVAKAKPRAKRCVRRGTRRSHQRR